MKIKLIFLFVIIAFLLSCKKDNKILQSSPTAKVLLLKVDYITNTFQGGKELIFSKNPSTFTISNEYEVPSDLGNIKLKYQEIDETLFDGTIFWMGRGKMNFPTSFEPENQFSRVLTNDFIYPSSGFQNVFNPFNKIYDYTSIWNSVQNLEVVRQYMSNNPTSTVKLFLYTPDLPGISYNAHWVIFLKN